MRILEIRNYYRKINAGDSVFKSLKGSAPGNMPIDKTLATLDLGMPETAGTRPLIEKRTTIRRKGPAPIINHSTKTTINLRSMSIEIPKAAK